MRQLQQKISRGVHYADFPSLHQSIGDNSRQDCCRGLGKRASAAIRDNKSDIRSRMRSKPLQRSTDFHPMKFSTTLANPISILLVSLASIATASGQAPTWNPRVNRPVEKYDNPPALIYR